MAKKKEIKNKVLPPLDIPEPPMAPRFPEFLRAPRIGFNRLSTSLQILIIFGWIFFGIVLINIILAMLIYLMGGA